MDMQFDPKGAEAVGAGERLVAYTELALESAIDDLGSLMNGLKEGRFEEVRDVQKVMRGLRESFNNAVAERKKVEQLRREIAGSVGDRDLDLRSARDEIGRRLALLRNAGGD